MENVILSLSVKLSSIQKDTFSCKFFKLLLILLIISLQIHEQKFNHTVKKFLGKLKLVKRNINIPLTEKPFLESLSNTSFLSGEFTEETSLSQMQTSHAKDKKITGPLMLQRIKNMMETLVGGFFCLGAILIVILFLFYILL